MPSFSTTRSELVFSGRIAISIRCSPAVKKQWSIAIATARGMMPRPAYSLVDPVADRGELRRAAHDVVDGQLAGEPAVDVDRERAASCPARASGAAGGPAAGTCAGWASTAGGTVASHGAARPRCAARTARHASPVGAARSAAAATSPRRRAATGQPALNGRSRRSARRRARRSGSSTASPSFTPPREPGRLTTRHAPTTPASPRDSAAVGTPLADAVRADRLGDAGHLAVEQRRGSPRASGRSGSGRCRRW